jgi:hypothetical protein
VVVAIVVKQLEPQAPTPTVGKLSPYIILVNKRGKITSLGMKILR